MQACQADHYLGEMCVTYVGFTDFQNSLTATGDSKNLQFLSRPVLWTTHNITRAQFFRLQNWNERLRRRTDSHNFDTENLLRTIRSKIKFTYYQLLLSTSRILQN